MTVAHYHKTHTHVWWRKDTRTHTWNMKHYTRSWIWSRERTRVCVCFTFIGECEEYDEDDEETVLVKFPLVSLLPEIHDWKTRWLSRKTSTVRVFACVCVCESSRCRKIPSLHEYLMSLPACVRSSMLKSWEFNEKSMRNADKEPRSSWAGTGVVFLSPVGGGAGRGWPLGSSVGVDGGLGATGGWRREGHSVQTILFTFTIISFICSFMTGTQVMQKLKQRSTVDHVNRAVLFLARVPSVG